MSIAANIKAADQKAGRFGATGKRKDAIARVRVMKAKKAGSGKVTINNKDIAVYFGRPVSQMVALQSLEAIDGIGNFDIFVNAHGGGLSGQAGAIRHGIAKALVDYDESLRPVLKEKGFLTRDSRVVESKKYGRHKARRSTQFSKR